jgi:hypothetical protein
MRLYRYMSLDNLWFLLDLVVDKRIHCATWDSLNDPLEGSYEVMIDRLTPDQRLTLEQSLEANRNSWRIASFSASATNLLLWSHYAAGHKGVAVELKFPDDQPGLHKVKYSDFSYIFGDDTDPKMSYPGIFSAKTEEWAYEKEWRIISREEFVPLTDPCQRILIGPQVSDRRSRLLRKLLPRAIKMIPMHVNPDLMRVEPIGSAKGKLR